MPINLPSLKAKPAELADWVELRTLAAPNRVFRVNRLKRYWDTHRETESSDPEGLKASEKATDDQGVNGEDADRFFDAITDELGERLGILKECYPFQFVDSKFSLKEQGDISDGSYAYLFCLLLSNCKQGEVFDGTWLPHVDGQVRDLFQACSTLAAAGHVRGCAFSFGWPRPNDNPPFLQKLREIYALFGEGEVVDAPRPGVSPHVKDEEIDVIAWRPRADGAAGKEYLLGQVASGDNWEAKSIKGGAITYLHHNWFSRVPNSDATPSIFIPHSTPPMGDGSRKERIEAATAKYGRIFDRLILPHDLQEGITLVDRQEAGVHIERRDDFPNVIQWVNGQLDGLRAAGEGPL